MPKRKDSSSSSSSAAAPPSIDGTVKRRRARRRLDHSLKELKEEMTQIRSSMEGFQRKVTEEINELKNAIILTRPFPISSWAENIRNLKLQCITKLPQRVFTGSKLVGNQGTGIQISLHDADTDQIIATGTESSIKVHAVVLEGDFNREDRENWSREEFDSHIVKERQQRRPLLIGELQVMLKEGAGSLNNLIFTDNSSWNRSKMFRIGVQVASGYCEGIRIREALTEPFFVLEQRGESYMKHHPPQSSDYVWRLNCIGKDGPFHTRLNEANICNVEEFLQAISKDQQALREILGPGMTRRKWDSLIDHAKTCPPNGKYYVFYNDAKRNSGLLFDNFACLTGLIQNGKPQPINSMSDSEKQRVDALVKKAHQNWKDVTEYPGLHGPDPVIERGVIPCPLAAVLPGNHNKIPSGQSGCLQDFPNQISLREPYSGLTSLYKVDASSSTAAEQASTSQQIDVQVGENSMPWQLVQSTLSSSYNVAPCRPSCELFDDKLLSNSPGGSFADMLNNLHSYGSFDCFPDLADLINDRPKAIIGWLQVKAVLKWGSISKKRSIATLIEL